jgi:hypothetical protein
MEPIKVVVHYINGEVIKGSTRDFFPNKDLFHLFLTTDPTGEAIEVLMKDLKAIFFVRDFTGDPQYNERKIFLEGENSPGRKGYDPSRKGFCLFPADPETRATI